MKKKINKSNLIDRVYIFIVRAGLVFVLIGTLVVLVISTIIQSMEILNVAKYVLPSILIFIGSYSILFGVSEKPMRTMFSSRSTVKEQIIKLFSNKYNDVFEYGLVARITGFVAILMGILLMILMRYV